MRHNTSIRSRPKAHSRRSSAPEPEPVPARTDTDHRLALRGRLASVALVMVLLALSTFAVVSSHFTSNVARATPRCTTR